MSHLTEQSRTYVSPDVPADLWPLPLTPVESFFALDDRPDYVLTFFLEMDCRGVIVREAWEEAFRQALRRHPLLTARVQTPRRGPLCWVPADEPPTVDWDADGVACMRPGERGLDLRRVAGLRTWVRVGENRSHVLFEFHHATCDATAAFGFIDDLLMLYQGLLADGNDGGAP